MRGTFVFPAADRDFLQLLELRANNGATELVETVYVLTGSTYYVPEQLFAFDDPGLYYEATPYLVDADREAIAADLARLCRIGLAPAPKLIMEVHTHPSGSTIPSDRDRRYGPENRPVYDRYFTDFEFFYGIHGLQDRDRPDPACIRCPEQTDYNEIGWQGENMEHRLGVYDYAFDPQPVMLR